jgi:hypothetical protein
MAAFLVAAIEVARYACSRIFSSGRHIMHARARLWVVLSLIFAACHPGEAASTQPDKAGHHDETAVAGAAGSFKADWPSEYVGAPTLVGTQVSFGVHCCTAPPDSTNLQSQPLTASVTGAIEFPAIDAEANNTLRVIAADVDVTDTGLALTYTQPDSAIPGGFNGYSFDFRGSTFKKITGAELAASSTAPVEHTVITFKDKSVFINVAELQTAPGMRIVVDLSLE